MRLHPTFTGNHPNTMDHEDRIYHHRFENGLTLVAESMPWLESAAFSFYVPAGCFHDPNEKLGLANFACEMVQRGSGKRSSREFVEHLQYLGINDASRVGLYHAVFAGACPADRLIDALDVYADMLRRPWLPPEQIEDARQVCLQEVRSIEDDLPQKVMLSLESRHYGPQLGRASQGATETVMSITHEDIARFYSRFYQPHGLIIGIAGKINWEHLRDRIGALTADWSPQPISFDAPVDRERGIFHIPFESNQTHIGVIYPTVDYTHPRYFEARAAVGVLGDGMSSRLFLEMREKRGLCYAVSASMHMIRGHGCVTSYIGTSAERAQESLDVLLEQIDQLSSGVTVEELDRLKIQFRSALVMQQESSRFRAGAVAGDWFYLQRVRTVQEITDAVMNLSTESVGKFLVENPPQQFDVVTLGPQPLQLPYELSAIPTG